MTKLASITVLSNDIKDTAFSLDAFHKSGHQYAFDLFKEIIHTFQSIVVTTSFRFSRPLNQRQRHTRNFSQESTPYSSDWAIDKSSFKKAAKDFYNLTTDYRDTPTYKSFLQSQHIVGSSSSFEASTPEGQVPSAPRLKSRFLDVDDTPIPSRNREATSSTPGNKITARETSAEEGIYRRFIGPSSPSSKSSQSTPSIQQDPSIKMTTFTTNQQRTIAEIVRQVLVAQPTPPGPSGPVEPKSPEGPPGHDGSGAGGSR